MKTPRGSHTHMLEKVRSRARKLDTIGHLGPEAVVAFVDGEMPQKAAHRVRVHIVHCPECRAEVQQQRGASEWVRQCNVDLQVRAPQDLLAKLNGIAAAMSAEVAGNTATNTSTDSSASNSAQRRQQDIGEKLEALRRVLRRGSKHEH